MKSCINGNSLGWQLLLLLLITSLITTAAEAATGEVDISTVYQELDGFGASNGWSSHVLRQLGNYYPEVYDVIFGDLGLDILRTRNTYGYAGDSANYISECAEAIADGRARTGRPLKILISSWSPKASLKSNSSESGGGGSNATLKKSGGNYVYAAYADWWADSLEAWDANGVVADYISIQNEPDWDASWDSCRFEPSETASIAGYDKAYEAVYSELYSRMGLSMPKMLGPETTGHSRAAEYIDAMDNLSHVYGYDHHLYNCNNGGNAGCGNEPDLYLDMMTDFAEIYGYKPLMQTEYSDDAYYNTHASAMYLAVLMHNSLVVEGVSSYMYWQLIDGSWGLVGISYSEWFIHTIYYAFKHYSAFTDPGWHRVEASTNSSDLRISAFMSPDRDELTIVIINTSTGGVSLDLTLNDFSPDDSDVYQSTSGSYWADISPFDPSMSLPAQSITTIHLTGTASTDFSDCDEVQAAGYALKSDISGDCYVNYKDLKVMGEYWANQCFWPNNDCEGADLDLPDGDGDVDFFDYVQLISQWLQCNDPENMGCEQNW